MWTSRAHWALAPISLFLTVLGAPHPHQLHEGSNKLSVEDMNEPQYLGPEVMDLTPFRACLAIRGLSPELTLFEYTPDPRADYALYNYQWEILNPMYTPAAYFLPRSTADVQAGVRCGRQLRLPLVPKGGGHSYEKYSFTHGIDGPRTRVRAANTIIVDLQRLNTFLVDAAVQEVVLGAGHLLAHVSYPLYADHSLVIPHGTCPTVGLAGLALGGGIGDLSRVYGLTTDAVLELELVTPDGELLVVNRGAYPDLFWALKGAGHHSYGVVTKFKFRGYPAPKMVVSGTAWYPMEEFEAVFSAWQELLSAELEDRVSPALMAYAGGFNLDVDEVQLDEADADAGFERLRAIFARFPVTHTGVRYEASNWTDFLMKSMYAASYGVTRPEEFVTLTRRSHGKRHFDAKSFFMKTFVDEEAVQAMQSHLESIPHETIVSFNLLGGKVSLAQEYSSFAHRDAIYIVQAYYQGHAEASAYEVESAQNWLRAFFQMSRDVLGSSSSYPNYSDGEMRDWLGRYYGGNVQRLVEVKRGLDPDNYFNGPQTMPVYV